jgi:hypothetical protein
MIVGTCSMYSVDGPLPPPRPPPPPPEKEVLQSYRYKAGYYQSLVEDDAKKVGLEKPSVKHLRKGNRHFIEFTGNQLLRIGGRLETAHLLLQSQLRKLLVGEEGQGYRTAHLVLSITNKTNHHLAYRVLTATKGKCASKGHMPHNAIALPPKGKVVRTECLSRGSRGIRVRRVEVLRIPPLGYYYVSRLHPEQMMYNRRTAAGHNFTQLPVCKLLPWRQIQSAFKRRDARWHDVIDFYSRHNCDEYSFFVGYEWKKAGPGELPVKPPPE